ncbi:hypothetical protein AKO1_000622 [Acrasis kona]|uniref:Uncharacterized protein n=1 Tax=Acrasis kona TaxID=1008807 RepID=A0AAW2ZSP6_9EUKA
MRTQISILIAVFLYVVLCDPVPKRVCLPDGFSYIKVTTLVSRIAGEQKFTKQEKLSVKSDEENGSERLDVETVSSGSSKKSYSTLATKRQDNSYNVYNWQQGKACTCTKTARYSFTKDCAEGRNITSDGALSIIFSDIDEAEGQDHVVLHKRITFKPLESAPNVGLVVTNVENSYITLEKGGQFVSSQSKNSTYFGYRPTQQEDFAVPKECENHLQRITSTLIK